MTIIMTCTCKHEFQDERYGVGKRVFNSTGKAGVYRCTVCRSEKTVAEGKGEK